MTDHEHGRFARAPSGATRRTLNTPKLTRVLLLA